MIAAAPLSTEQHLLAPRAARVWHDVIAALLLVLLGAGWCAWLGTLTSGIDTDSVTYLDAARAVQSRGDVAHRWAYWDPIYDTGALPTPVSLWPAGYPCLIAWVEPLAGDFAAAARWISLIASAAAALPMFLLARRLVAGPGAALATLTAMSSVSVGHYATQVATESTFTLALGAVLLLSALALEHSRRGGAAVVMLLALASVCAGLGLTQRYVGLALIGGVGLVALLCACRATGWTRAGVVLAAALPAGAACWLVMFRNARVAGVDALGWPGADLFWSTLPDALRSTVTLVTGAQSPSGRWWLLSTYGLAVVTLLLAAGVGSAQARRSASAKRPAQPPRSSASAVLVTTALFMTLLVMLTLVARVRQGMNLEPRLILPAMPWLLTLLVALAWRQASSLRRAAVTAAALGLTALQAHATATLTRTSAADIGKPGATQAAHWLVAHLPPDQVLLTARGAEFAAALPNPIVRLPRLPYARATVHDLAALDALADRFEAAWFAQIAGARPAARFDAAQQALLDRLLTLETSPERAVLRIGDVQLLQVGSRRVAPSQAALDHAVALRTAAQGAAP